MVNGRENQNLWNETFNRKASGIQILQTDISREIAENSRLRLSGTLMQQLVAQGTNKLQAYKLLVKRRFHPNKEAILLDRMNKKKSASIKPLWQRISGLAEND